MSVPMLLYQVILIEHARNSLTKSDFIPFVILPFTDSPPTESLISLLCEIRSDISKWQHNKTARDRITKGIKSDGVSRWYKTSYIVYIFCQFYIAFMEK